MGQKIILNKHENKTSSLFGIPEIQCQKCKKLIMFLEQPVYEVDTTYFLEKEEINFKSLIDFMIKKESMKNCCWNNIDFKGSGDRCVILKFSSSVPVNLNQSDQIYGRKFIVTSSVIQKFVQISTSITKCFVKTIRMKLVKLKIQSKK